MRFIKSAATSRISVDELLFTCRASSKSSIALNPCLAVSTLCSFVANLFGRRVIPNPMFTAETKLARLELNYHFISIYAVSGEGDQWDEHRYAIR